MHNLYEETEEINDSLNQSICANKYVTKVYKIFVNEYECSFCCISRIIMLIAFIYLLCLWMGFFIEGTIEKMSNNTVTLPFCSERGYKLILGCLMDYYENFTENQNDSPELNDIHAEL